MRHVTITALIALACLGIPATALAGTTAGPAVGARNAHADRTALSAYSTYLQALLTAKTGASRSEQSFSAATTGTCYRALEPIETSQSLPASMGVALVGIGDEISADADLASLPDVAAPFAKLSSTLTTLRWGSAGPAAAVRRFLAAQSALLALTPSNLCGDALYVASEMSAQQVAIPPATSSFLTAYDADSALASTRLAAFVKTLASYETTADRPLLTRINSLAKQVDKLVEATVTSGTTALYGALGIPAELKQPAVRGASY